MPTNVSFWSELTDRIEGPLPDEVVDLMVLEGLEDEFLSAADDSGRESVISRATSLLARLVSVGLVPAHDPLSATPADPRWALIAELKQAVDIQRRRAVSHWEAVRAEIPKRAMPNPLGLSRVTLSVDSSMSRQAVQQAVGAIWSELRERGDIRRTRPIGDRAIELVRFVCLEQKPTDTWRERYETWNAAHPESTFASARAFHSAFRRAETQLTGAARGLAWFHDPQVRFQYMSARERIEEVESGNEQAIEYVRSVGPIHAKAAMAAAGPVLRGLIRDLSGSPNQEAEEDAASAEGSRALSD